MILIELNDEQEKHYKFFYDYHYKKHKDRKGLFSFGALGFSVYFHVYPTGIGDAIEAECSICHKKITLQELS